MRMSSSSQARNTADASKRAAQSKRAQQQKDDCSRTVVSGSERGSSASGACVTLSSPQASHCTAVADSPYTRSANDACRDVKLPRRTNERARERRSQNDDDGEGRLERD